MGLPRVHLFEWHDRSWCPTLLRRGATDYLATALALARPFQVLAPRIAALLDASSTDTIVDLASGGTGPWRALAGEVAACRGGRPPRIVLTDLFPDEVAFRNSGHAYEPAAVDARAVPARLTGVRTMFDAFHHLRPDDARAVLADAHDHHAPIVIGEAFSRTPGTLLGMVLLVPLLVLVFTPLARPSLARLLLTYVVPILPLLIWWDGIVSCLRTYRPHELRALAAGLDGFRWEAGEIAGRGHRVTYLVGYPESSDFRCDA